MQNIYDQRWTIFIYCGNKYQAEFHGYISAAVASPCRDATTLRGMQNMLLVKRVAKLAEAKGCSPGQLALAWVLAQGDDVIPIPGARPC